jgi:WD40 repeat protein
VADGNPHPDPHPNPYPGTCAFETADSRWFHGRRREAGELLSLVVSCRAVLLCSPSGAGKTSLIQAALLGSLQGLRRAVVLPPARVGDPVPSGHEPANVHAFSVFQHLLPPSRLPEAAGWTLAEGLAEILDPEAPCFLILDQFEEIFTTHPDRFPQRKVFFEQLGEALGRHRRLSLLLAMREDFVAQLTPFLPLFPDRLRARLRLDLLDEAAALAAVMLPAKEAGISFRDEATARRLVDDLRRERVAGADGQPVEQLGQYVDPVHLQLVCRRLWDGLPAGASEIGPEQIKKAGGVDATLAGYYAEEVERVAGLSGMDERVLRAWFGRQLITQGGIRRQVLSEDGRAEGIPDAVVAQLVETRLVRREPRHGASWFELAHDRLVEPVRRDNQRWLASHRTDLEQRAALWRSQGRDPRLLLVNSELEAARAESEGRIRSPEEEEFLQACAAEDEKNRRQRHRTRRRIGRLIAATLVLLPLVAARFYGSGLRNGLDAQVRARKATELDLALLLTVAMRPEGEVNGRELSETLESSPRLQRFLHGHAENHHVLGVAFLPGAHGRRLLASGGTDGLVQVWDADTGKPARRPLQGTQQVWTVAFSPDGRWIAFGCRKNGLYLWDMESPFPLRLGPGKVHGGKDIYAVRFSPGGGMLASAGGDGSVQLWDVETRRRLRVLAGSGEWVTSLAFNRDGSLLASGSRDRTIRLWDPESGAALGTLEGEHKDWVTDLAFDPLSPTLASAGLDGTVVFWDLTRQRIRERLEGLSGPLTAVAYSPDGRILAVGGLDGSLTLRDAATLSPLAWPLTGQASFLRSLAFSPDSRTLASGSGSKVVLWNVERSSSLGETARQTLPLDPVTAVAATRDGRWIAVAGTDTSTGKPSVRLVWPDGRLRRGPWSAPATVRSLAVSPDGRLLASGGDDGSLTVRNTASNASNTAWKQAGHRDRVSVLAFHPGGRRLVSASWDGTFALWDARTGRRLAARPAGQDRVLAAAFTPRDGSLLATAGLDRTIRLWRLDGKGLPVPSGAALQGHTDRVSSLAFSPDGATLASGSWDATIALWNLRAEKPERVASLRGHVLPVLHLAFSPDGRTLASAGWDYKIALWDTVRRAPLTPLLSVQHSRIEGLAFPPGLQGRLLAVGADGSLASWRTVPRDWQASACDVANRPLTEREWCTHIGPFPLYDPVCPAAEKPTLARLRAARACTGDWMVEPLLRPFPRLHAFWSQP